MPDELPWDLLDRYFSGECSDAEGKRVERWLAADTANAETITFAREIWERSADLSLVFDVDEAWERTAEQIRRSSSAVQLHSGSDQASKARGGRRRAYSILRIAAALVIAVAAGSLLLPRYGARNGDGAVTMRSLTTGIGEQRALRLADGTRVVLSPATRLRIPADFGAGNRTVHLDAGEAYFEVRHDADDPFQVLTPGAIAEDLGTEFLMRTDSAGQTVQVVVASGELGLRAATVDRERAVLLTPGQLGRLDSRGTVGVDSLVNVESYLAWVSGTLSFDRVPLSMVMGDLERWYGVSFVAADPGLDEVMVTATFSDQSLESVLSTLALALDASYERADDLVTFSATPRAR